MKIPETFFPVSLRHNQLAKVKLAECRPGVQIRRSSWPPCCTRSQGRANTNFSHVTPPLCACTAFVTQWTPPSMLVQGGATFGVFITEPREGPIFCLEKGCWLEKVAGWPLPPPPIGSGWPRPKFPIKIFMGLHKKSAQISHGFPSPSCLALDNNRGEIWKY